MTDATGPACSPKRVAPSGGPSAPRRTRLSLPRAPSGTQNSRVRPHGVVDQRKRQHGAYWPRAARRRPSRPCVPARADWAAAGSRPALRAREDPGERRWTRLAPSRSPAAAQISAPSGRRADGKVAFEPQRQAGLAPARGPRWPICRSHSHCRNEWEPGHAPRPDARLQSRANSHPADRQTRFCHELRVVQLDSLELGKAPSEPRRRSPKEGFQNARILRVAGRRLGERLKAQEGVLQRERA